MRLSWMMAAAALVAAEGAAAATPPACVTRAQINDATLFALPSILEAAAARCRPSLPANAYLLNGGQELARRLAATSEQHWAGALAVLRTFNDGKKMPMELSQDTARGLLRDAVASEVLNKASPADCLRLNEGADILSPLPPENLGRLVALFVDVAAQDERAKGKRGTPAICP